MTTVEKTNKRSGVMTLDQVVRMCLMDIGAGLERYEQFLQWGIDCHRDYQMDMAREFKAVELEMTAWKAIEWPSDYVDWVRIGARQNGRVVVFTNDPDIPLAFDLDGEGFPTENEITQLNDAGTIEVDPGLTTRILNLNDRGEDAGGVFGLVAKDNGVGYYRVNRERKEIQMSPIIDADTIYLEYIADGYNPCTKTLVPLYAVQLHRLYIHWQRLKFSRSTPQSEKREAKQEYWDEFRRVAARLDETTIADIIEAAVNGYVASPHF